MELAAACGLNLDEAQQSHLAGGMGERADGLWAASDVGIIASRQNGKNGTVEGRELYGLSVLGEWIIHTAHQFKTTMESYKRLMALVLANPEVAACLIDHHASPMSGYDMTFRGGGQIKFIARSRTSGRGLTGDVLVLDEAQDMNEDALGALLPTISARPNPQVWYLGSAPGIGSEVQHRLRKRGRSGDSDLAYFEHSAHPDSDLDDRAGWAQGNWALNTRIMERTVERERAALSDEVFARERLSISPDLADGGLFGIAWSEICDPDLEAKASAFGLDVNPERSQGSIVAAQRDDPILELVDVRAGVGWIVDRAEDLYRRYKVPIAIDDKGPAGSFIPELERRRVKVVPVVGTDLQRACGSFYDRVTNRQVRVRQHAALDAAVMGAEKRPVGDAFTWARKNSKCDISPLVAGTVGLWVATQHKRARMTSMADVLDEEG